MLRAIADCTINWIKFYTQIIWIGGSRRPVAIQAMCTSSKPQQAYDVSFRLIKLKTSFDYQWAHPSHDCGPYDLHTEDGM